LNNNINVWCYQYIGIKKRENKKMTLEIKNELLRALSHQPNLNKAQVEKFISIARIETKFPCPECGEWGGVYSANASKVIGGLFGLGGFVFNSTARLYACTSGCESSWHDSE